MGRSSGEALARIEEELVAERAAALRRIADRLAELIEELHDLRRASRAREAAGAPLVDQYRAVQRQARRYRWYLEVQREAIGLRRHEMLDELYPIPAEPF
jgi:acyl-CoA reductase-like NAD-dependent aldehyde dehydrogenase